ncbi:lamin tail domain-containing protein [Planococcus salinarum]|uniref:lamin tail domain-containing protein n=1 Tax=Planococcus salinarum TaxID=622695 RepID=UPI00163DD334|nr:lamin tail domain-containing protein [Planococcus salinarum]
MENEEHIASVIETGQEAHAATTNAVAINEIAWMGTCYSYNNERIELHNTTNSAIDMTGWTLNVADGSSGIILSGMIVAGDYYLLERPSNNSAASVAADLLYTGSLGNSGKILELRDASGALIDSADG